MSAEDSPSACGVDLFWRQATAEIRLSWPISTSVPVSPAVQSARRREAQPKSAAPTKYSESERSMFAQLLQRLAAAGRRIAQTLRRRLLVATKPAAAAPLVGTLADLVRSKPALILENALLRQQLIILRRGVKRPRCTADRPRAPGAAGQPPAHLATRPAHRPARHPAALASGAVPPLLAPKVTCQRTGAPAAYHPRRSP